MRACVGIENRSKSLTFLVVLLIGGWSNAGVASALIASADFALGATKGSLISVADRVRRSRSVGAATSSTTTSVGSSLGFIPLGARFGCLIDLIASSFVLPAIVVDLVVRWVPAGRYIGSELKLTGGDGRRIGLSPSLPLGGWSWGSVWWERRVAFVDGGCGRLPFNMPLTGGRSLWRSCAAWL